MSLEIFSSEPQREAVTVFDERGEVRQRLIAAHILVPAPPRQRRSAASLPVDTAAHHATACEIIIASGVPEARAIADCADTDPRLAVALRTILSLPHATREQVISRRLRKRC